MDLRDTINAIDATVRRIIRETPPVMIYGNKYGLSITVTVSSAGVCYPLTTLTDGAISGMTHASGTDFRIATPGKYMVSWSLTMKAGAAAQVLFGSILKNGTVQTNLSARAYFAGSSQAQNIGSVGMLTLAAGDGVRLGTGDETAVNNVTVDYAAINLMWLDW